MKRIIAVVVLAVMAGQASATLGSVISSFYIGKTVEPTSYYVWIYRDAGYVYAGWRYWQNELDIFMYTAAGSFVKLVGEWYVSPFDDPGGITRCHLGSSYQAFSIIGIDEIWITRDWGDIIQSFPAQRPGGGGPGDIMWDGRYYHVHDGGGKYNLYTTAGALAGQWTVAGWPAGMKGGYSTFSKSFDNAGGRYLFVAGSGNLHCVFNMNDGSLVASWGRVVEGAQGQSYGDAYPASYGGALWYHGYIWQTDAHWAYQIDVDARGATNVLPASVGKIKAIYR